jgi:hypothetical protein
VAGVPFIDRDLIVENATREELEERLVASYEAYVALKSVYRTGGRTPDVYTALLRETQLQRYLHALLGYKGEPPGLLY